MTSSQYDLLGSLFPSREWPHIPSNEEQWWNCDCDCT